MRSNTSGSSLAGEQQFFEPGLAGDSWADDDGSDDGSQGSGSVSVAIPSILPESDGAAAPPPPSTAEAIGSSPGSSIAGNAVPANRARSSEVSLESGQRRAPAVKKTAPKPNKIKKGDGIDGVPDPLGRANFDFQGTRLYLLLSPHFVKRPSLALFRFCRLVEAELYKLRIPHTPTNRWTTQRIPDAYCWLEENQGLITDGLFFRCLSQLWEEGLLG
jgi:hypothetical protein